MAEAPISELDTAPSVDRAVDVFPIVHSGTTYKITPNATLGLTGDPVGTSDTQTLTNKTLTSPTISGPTLSGTIAGTYTIGGTPTFPSSVVTLTGTQTLTNKTLTSPVINTATIANPTITTDAISEHTSANGVTIDGLNIKDSKLNTNNSVVTANITNDAVTDAKLIYGKVRSRQGGSATDWNTNGTTTYDYSGTDTFIQAGAIAVSANPTTVTFPTAFNQVPVVVATLSTATSANVFVICTAKTATTASFRCVNDAGTVATTESINWIAIGQ